MRATVLLSMGDHVRSRIGIPVEPLERQEWEHLVNSLRAQLGDDAFAGAWADGQQLSVAQAIDLATLV